MRCHHMLRLALMVCHTIVPIYKGGNNSAACNYRPVSLTSNIMKIFERVIRKQLLDYMTENDLLNHTQHGFRHGRSCLSALLSVYLLDLLDMIRLIPQSARPSRCKHQFM